MYSGYFGKRRSVEGMRMDPNESRMVMGSGQEPDVLLLRHLELLNCEYFQSLNHLLRGGPYAGQVAARVIFSDEGLVELDRLAGDEAADELDRLAAQILTHHPHSRARLDRLRASANAAMDERTPRAV
jgi:hypothetical protein